MTGTDNALVTVNWDQAPPVSNPESRMTGGMYQDIDAQRRHGRSHDPTSWALAGTGLTAGQHLPEGAPGRVRPVRARAASAPAERRHHRALARPQPARQLLGHDLVHRSRRRRACIDTGNASWVGQMADAPLIPTIVLPAPVPGVTPVPAADHDERLLGARGGPGEHHPPLDRQLAERLPLTQGHRVQPVTGPSHARTCRRRPGHAAARDAVVRPGPARDPTPRPDPIWRWDPAGAAVVVAVPREWFSR